MNEFLFFGTRMKKKFSHPKGFEWANNIQDAFSDLPEVNPIDGKPKSTELKLMKDIKGKRRKNSSIGLDCKVCPSEEKRRHRDCTYTIHEK